MNAASRLPRDRVPRDRDTEIARRLVGRDADGLRQLLKTHAGKVKWCLTRELGGSLGEVEIEEAINTAAFKAWSAAHSYDANKGSLRAWFYTIARNAALGILRRDIRQRGPVRSDDVDVASLSSFRAAPAAPSDAHASFLENLRNCISRLPPNQQTIIQADLRSGDVANSDELAKDLNTTKNSIYASRSIARKTLRKALGELRDVGERDRRKNQAGQE